jgi:hypothetical protein
MGNSPERRKIKDLGDVIYYKQKKDYTDQEFSDSLDLQREIQAGKILLLERLEPIKVTSADTGLKSEDIKSAVADALSRLPKPETVSIEDIKRLIQETLGNQSQPENIALLIAETIRRELSGISQLGIPKVTVTEPSFVGSEYVPTVTTENMKSSIKAAEQTTKGDDVSNSLEQLRKLNG